MAKNTICMKCMNQPHCKHYKAGGRIHDKGECDDYVEYEIQLCNNKGEVESIELTAFPDNLADVIEYAYKNIIRRR